MARLLLLTPKAFAVLRYLVEHAGQLVTQGVKAQGGERKIENCTALGLQESLRQRQDVNRVELSLAALGQRRIGLTWLAVVLPWQRSGRDRVRVVQCVAEGGRGHLPGTSASRGAPQGI
jgi:hypothetical protein